MPTYYETLNSSPSASLAEIQVAYETQYNKWRRLVTHHDPQVVNQANQALQYLEKIRTTLIDSDKRTVYDDAIGISKNIGSLGDPDALLSTAYSSTLPSPTSSPKQNDLAKRVDSWTCPKCKAPSPVGARF